MPAEDAPHERTWMCWPSSEEIWGEDLIDVQDAIARIALAISDFEPVTMLVRPDARADAESALGGDVKLLDAPVDDLWARDTLPNFLLSESGALGAGHARFNGWGGKQTHDGDSTLAAVVAAHLRIELIDSGLVGEGGGIEVDGHATVLAAESSWVNENRNPGRSRAQIETSMLAMVGAKRMIWVDGLAGRDITDGHIDTLARFISAETIVIDAPAFDDPEDPWVAVAARTREQVTAARSSRWRRLRGDRDRPAAGGARRR